MDRELYATHVGLYELMALFSRSCGITDALACASTGRPKRRGCSLFRVARAPNPPADPYLEHAMSAFSILLILCGALALQLIYACIAW